MYKKEEVPLIFKNENIEAVLREAEPESWLFRMSQEKNAVCISWLEKSQYTSIRLQFLSDKEGWADSFLRITHPSLPPEDPLLKSYPPQTANLIVIASSYENYFRPFPLKSMLKPSPDQAVSRFEENFKSQKAEKGIAWLAETKAIKSSSIFKQEKDRDIVAALQTGRYTWALRESSSQNSILLLKLQSSGRVLASPFILTNRGWVEVLETGDQHLHRPILKTDPLLSHYQPFEFADLMAILICKESFERRFMYLPKQEESSIYFSNYRPRRDDLVEHKVGSEIPCPIEEIQKLKSQIASLPQYEKPRAPNKSEFYACGRKGLRDSLMSLRQTAYSEDASFETLLTRWVLANNTLYNQLAPGLICPMSGKLMLGKENFPVIVAEKGYRAYAYSCIFTAEGRLKPEWAFLRETPYGLEGYAKLSQDCIEFFESYVKKNCAVDEMADIEKKYRNQSLLSSSSSSSSAAVSTQSIFRPSGAEANRKKDEACDYVISDLNL